MHREQPDVVSPLVVELEQLRRAQGAPGVPRPFATIIRAGHGPDSRAAVIGAYGLVALVAAGQAVNVQVNANPAWWSYVPAGVSAVAAITTFGITFILWRRGATDRARDQASQVFVSTSRDIKPDGSMLVVARVHNQSDTPIWDVEVHPRRDGATYEADLAQRFPDVMPLCQGEFSWLVAKPFVPAEDRYPELIFVDAAQRRWKRVGVSLTRS